MMWKRLPAIVFALYSGAVLAQVPLGGGTVLVPTEAHPVINQTADSSGYNCVNPLSVVNSDTTGGPGLFLCAIPNQGQIGPEGAYINGGAESLVLFKGMQVDTVLPGLPFVSQFGAHQQSFIELGLGGMQFWETIPRNYPGPVTISIASPAVVTLNSNGLSNGVLVYFTTTGALPTGISPSTVYCTLNVTTNTFQLETWNGAICTTPVINTSGTQSGVQTLVSDSSPLKIACIGTPSAGDTGNCDNQGVINKHPEFWVLTNANVQGTLKVGDFQLTGGNGFGALTIGKAASQASYIQFFNATSGQIDIAPPTGALNNGTLLVPNPSGTDTFATLGLNQTFSGTVNFSGTLQASGTAGVSCAANTVNLTTFAVTGGLVTHC